MLYLLKTPAIDENGQEHKLFWKLDDIKKLFENINNELDLYVAKIYLENGKPVGKISLNNQKGQLDVAFIQSHCNDNIAVAGHVYRHIGLALLEVAFTASCLIGYGGKLTLRSIQDNCLLYYKWGFRFDCYADLQPIGLLDYSIMTTELQEIVPKSQHEKFIQKTFEIFYKYKDDFTSNDAQKRFMQELSKVLHIKIYRNLLQEIFDFSARSFDAVAATFQTLLTSRNMILENFSRLNGKARLNFEGQMSLPAQSSSVHMIKFGLSGIIKTYQLPLADSTLYCFEPPKSLVPFD